MIFLFIFKYRMFSIRIHACNKLHQWSDQIKDEEERELSEYAVNSHLKAQNV